MCSLCYSMANCLLDNSIRNFTSEPLDVTPVKAKVNLAFDRRLNMGVSTAVN